MQNNQVCAVCGIASTLRCSGCQRSFYCTREHQKSHWKEHKKTCRTCKLVDHPELGRHYVAARDIAVGEIVVYDEYPLVRGPTFTVIQTYEGGSMKHVTPVCLGCYMRLKIDNVRACRQCGWRLCNDCQGHGAECEFTIKHRRSKVRITTIDDHEPIYQSIPIIRALAVKDWDPESYERLMKLGDRCVKIMNDPNIFVIFEQIAEEIQAFYRIQHIDKQEIAKLALIIQMNAQSVTSSKPFHAAVYEASAYIENNCKANCSTSYTDEGGLITWAAVPIAKGDHISICYPNYNWGTIKRRSYLQTSRYFDCYCERCKDPTEFMTMHNAYKCCIEGCEGWMLPSTFLVTDGDYPDYVCSECATTMPWLVIQQTDSYIFKDWTNMSKSQLEDGETFLEKWRKVLHDNHYYILDVEIDFAYEVGLCGSKLTERSDNCLAELIQLCDKLYTVITAFAPAENRVRGIVRFIHHSANEVVYERYKPVDQAKRYEFIHEGRKALRDIHQLLHREPSFCSLEYSIAGIVLEEITKIEVSLTLAEDLSALAL